MQNEHDDSVITCEKCNKSCKGGRKFKTHMNSHREVSCKHCGKKIPYNSTTSHVTKCIGEKSFKCENCPAVFNTEWNLKVHVTNKSCPVKCNRCDKTLKNAGYLDRHMASVHSVQMQVVKKLLTSALSNALKIHDTIKVCNIKSPQVVFKSACVLTMVAFVKKNVFFSPQVSFESAFVVL